MDFSAYLIKSQNEKKGKYNAAVSRSGHRFMPFILDKFGNVQQGTKDMLYQMFLRKVSNDKHDITEAEASFIATKKYVFRLKRIASAMAKTYRLKLCVSLTELPNLPVSSMKRNTAKVVKTPPFILITELILNTKQIK